LLGHLISHGPRGFRPQPGLPPTSPLGAGRPAGQLYARMTTKRASPFPSGAAWAVRPSLAVARRAWRGETPGPAGISRSRCGASAKAPSRGGQGPLGAARPGALSGAGPQGPTKRTPRGRRGPGPAGFRGAGPLSLPCPAGRVPPVPTAASWPSRAEHSTRMAGGAESGGAVLAPRAGGRGGRPKQENSWDRREPPERFPPCGPPFPEARPGGASRGRVGELGRARLRGCRRM